MGEQCMVYGAVQEDQEQGDEEGVEGASEGDCTLMTAVPGEW